MVAKSSAWSITWASGMRASETKGRRIASICSLGRAPVNSWASWPSLTILTAGMPWTRKAVASCWFSSTLIFARATPGPSAATTSSRMGPRVLQGPHQGAQKSTTMTRSCEPWRTSSSKFCSSTSNICGLGLDFHGVLPVGKRGICRLLSRRRATTRVAPTGRARARRLPILRRPRRCGGRRDGRGGWWSSRRAGG